MTLVPGDPDGRRLVSRAVAAGQAVILPLPSPLPYVVAGTDAGAVNVAKGRPAGQPAGVAVAEFGLVEPFLDLDADTRAFARWLTADRLLNLLLPVRDGGPAWLAPSTSRGRLAMMLGWLDQLRPLLDDHGHLYVSSANRTGGDVAVTAADAAAAFEGELPVLDGDRFRDATSASGSAAIVSVGPRGQLDVVRHGITDAAFGDDSGRFVAALEREWRARA